VCWRGVGVFRKGKGVLREGLALADWGWSDSNRGGMMEGGFGMFQEWFRKGETVLSGMGRCTGKEKELPGAGRNGYSDRRIQWRAGSE